ncbi:MAG: hypothetical protein OWV35_02215 [Firmicutes bacterium]|nr:hypothetical protein [Bacillota bacterium]
MESEAELRPDPMVLEWLRAFRDLYQDHEQRTAGQVLEEVALASSPDGESTDLLLHGTLACRLSWLPRGQVLVSALVQAPHPWVCILGDDYVMYRETDPGSARRVQVWEPFRSFRRFRFRAEDILPDLVLAADAILEDLPEAARVAVVGR